VQSRSAPLLLAGLALALGGCGNQVKSDAPSPTQQRAAFHGSPPPLAALHAQANSLLGGGTPALRGRLAALRGFPVVLNEWASWCGPCQSEFPVYQRVAVDYGSRVAFLGLDAKDSNGAASSFLRKFPVSYPSYTDPDGSVASALKLYVAYPQTIFFNRAGHQVYDHAGPYESPAALEHDIKRYGLQ
jgi:cytochrome c biogenesis protein CcmG/thiol:disulfide interchange protein DsbE